MMSKILAGLEPANVFSFFEAICAIPHGSTDTKRISDYCVKFAKERGLRCTQDAQNNVIIWKDGTKGYEDHLPVILQGHMDMVCEKEPDCTIDFHTDGLALQTDGKIVFAKGTTLGGDDGIAVAYALALLDSDSIPHPPLEVVLTVDEEIGMLGAAAMDLSELKGRILLNVDSEDEGVLTVSCAGGATATVSLPVRRTERLTESVNVTLTGLQGGHSGVEIHKPRINANKAMGEFLSLLHKNAEFSVVSLNGGLKDNAIARSCVAHLATDCAEKLTAEAEALRQSWLAKVRETEPQAELCIVRQEKTTLSVMENSTDAIELLCALPNGVQAMSKEIEGLVQTSLNLGILSMDEQSVNFTFSVRSSVNTEKDALLELLKTTGARFGAAYSQMGEYPAWEYNRDSKLRPLMVEVFEQQYGRKPVVEAIHAGLECGLLADKLPGLDCVSFGPDMTDIHTARETLNIASVRRTWDYLCAVLARL